MFSAIIVSLIFYLFCLLFFFFLFNLKYIFFSDIPGTSLSQTLSQKHHLQLQPYRDNRNRMGLAQVMESLLQSFWNLLRELSISCLYHRGKTCGKIHWPLFLHIPGTWAQVQLVAQASLRYVCLMVQISWVPFLAFTHQQRRSAGTLAGWEQTQKGSIIWNSQFLSLYIFLYKYFATDMRIDGQKTREHCSKTSWTRDYPQKRVFQ